MATSTISAPLNKFSYFRLSDTTNANGGYSSGQQDISQMYIGSSASSGTNPGTYVGVFGILLYDLFGGAVAKAIQSITLKITTTNASSGYNGCVARLEYIGTTYNSTTPLWRVGSSTEAINLAEAATNTMTTTDATTCTNLMNVTNGATSGQYHYFRIVRESGMGVWMSTGSGVEMMVEYTDSSATRTTAYIWGVSTQTYTFPETAMTSNSSANCVASASSEYNSSYAAWKAFNKSYSDTYGWAQVNSDTAPWLQLQMPIALCDISIKMVNRTRDSDVNGPVAGYVQGSNDGSAWTTLKNYSGFDGNTSGGVAGTVSCGNSTAYKYVRVYFTQGVISGYYGGCVGEMYITGSKTASSGGWIEAVPYVYTENGWKQASPYKF